MTKNLTLVTLIFFSVLSASAQKRGFVVTTQVDTIACKIKVSIFGQASYQPENKEKYIPITAKTISYYCRIKDSTKRQAARAVFMPKGKKRVFVDLVQEGDINIYEINRGGYNTPNTSMWYVDKGTDTLKELKTNAVMGKRKQRKEMFAAMLKDKPAIYEKFMADDSFGFEAISDIVYLYNSTPPYKSSAWRKDQSLFLKWLYR
ncbi:hypothetical protein DJ568_00680 [Mucilaginibacter hurinus]|uniref:DUF4369 domain-containing protein n=1 Tax=Mucilaginibacter hurinus TaxID=2201324 RepID=A0A367GT99_9SPHI|nr:hypothetical protein [Mucilaginibacter hurinus]RCH56408.1 hypothetical protein DJ568_00680 [Mucilaginibacter hurinus]